MPTLIRLTKFNMTTFEYILFFWLSMAIIKLTISLATILFAILEYRKTNNMDINIIGLMFGLCISGLMLGIYVVVMWPSNLYNEKLGFFKFPDKNMEGLYIKFMDTVNKD